MLAVLSGQTFPVVAKVLTEANEAWMWYNDQQFVACCGVQAFNLMTGDAVIWLYAGPRVKTCRVAFVKLTRDFCRLKASRAKLYAFVKLDFLASRKWLDFIGFRFVAETEASGLPVAMYQFEG